MCPLIDMFPPYAILTKKFFSRIVTNTYYQAMWSILASKVKNKGSFVCLSIPILVKFKTVKGCQGNLCRADARPGEGSLSTVLNLTKIGELRNKKYKI